MSLETPAHETGSEKKEVIEPTPETSSAPTPEEAKAMDIQRAAEVNEASLRDETERSATLDRLGVPLENRTAPEALASHKLTHELAELASGENNDSAETVLAMSPDGQTAFAQKFFEATAKEDGNPSPDAVRIYQAKFAGTPFGDEFKRLVQENYAKRGIEQDIDTVRL